MQASFRYCRFAHSKLWDFHKVVNSCWAHCRHVIHLLGIPSFNQWDHNASFYFRRTHSLTVWFRMYLIWYKSTYLAWLFFSFVSLIVRLNSVAMSLLPRQTRYGHNSVPLVNGLNLWMERTLCNAISSDEWANVLMAKGKKESSTTKLELTFFWCENWKRHFCGFVPFCVLGHFHFSIKWVIIISFV